LPKGASHIPLLNKVRQTHSGVKFVRKGCVIWFFEADGTPIKLPLREEKFRYGKWWVKPYQRNTADTRSIRCWNDGNCPYGEKCRFGHTLSLSERIKNIIYS
jgi:hypothetical protein